MTDSAVNMNTTLGLAWHVQGEKFTGQVGFITGSGSPNGSVTPAFVGQEYFDTVGQVFYIAYGLSNTNWSQIGAAELLSADTQAQAGSSTGTFGLEGNLSVQISSAGVNPGGTGSDYVLAAYSLPASFFDKAGRGITINASGSFAATSNNKRVKIIVNPASATVGSAVGSGGTTICDTGTVTTSGTGWAVEGSVYKYGAAGSNTQLGIHNQAQIGNAVASMLAPTAVGATESGAILIAITGNASTAASDILWNFLQVNATN